MSTNLFSDYNVKTIHIINDTNSEINIKIKRIYVINMIKDVVKRNYIITIMKKYNINFTIVLVKKVSTQKYNSMCEKQDTSRNISKGELGCCLSHMWCLYDIIKNKFENAIIFEDDILFHKDFITEFLHVYNSVKLDFLLLGAHDYHFESDNHNNVLKNQNLYSPTQTSNLYGAHANYYSLKAAKIMFNIRSSLITFFDKEYNLMFEHFKNTSFVCYPNLVVTNVSMSSLKHEKKFFSNEEEEYYKKCFVQFDFSLYHFIYLNIISENLLPICREDTYESYTDKSLYEYFYNNDCSEKIKKRISFDFFTLSEIQNIFFSQENEIELDMTKIYNTKEQKGDSDTFQKNPARVHFVKKLIETEKESYMNNSKDSF